jgi:hypothetical protein
MDVSTELKVRAFVSCYSVCVCVCVCCVYVGGCSSPAYERALNFVVGFFVMHLLIPFKVHMSRTR